MADHVTVDIDSDWTCVNSDLLGPISYLMLNIVTIIPAFKKSSYSICCKELFSNNELDIPLKGAKQRLCINCPLVV